MGYVVYEVKSGRQVDDQRRSSTVWNSKVFKTEAAAEACRTRLVRKEGYQYCELAVTTQELLPKRTRKVRNLMTGKEIEIDVNTPYCCDPSTERYWSM